ncbi:MAG: DUF1833 domain-containing protein [Desulfovibrio sp.]|jgi:hypothetical protein|nr:DUF1833 domain-containing protein [Desulfovibrio sp.]
MPTIVPITPETLKKGWEEAQASCLNDEEFLLTVEIQHKSLETPIRVARYPVTEIQHPLFFKCLLEDTAPYDPGQIVDFIACPFDVTMPEKSDSTPGEFSFVVAGIGYTLDADLETAAMSGGPIKAMLRMYTKGEEDKGPHPGYTFIFDCKEPSVSSTSGDLSFTGVIFDFIARPFGRLYRPAEYPQLVGSN